MTKKRERKEHLADISDILHDEPEESGRDLEIEGTEESPEPVDFMGQELGAADFMEAASEAEPYFPPTDPVVEPTKEHYEEIEVVGGYAPTSMEEMEDPYEPVTGGRGDDQITEEVLNELREDAGTTDLNVYVETREGVVHLRGVVPSLEDVELAEEVASRIAGVTEVREELEIEGFE